MLQRINSPMHKLWIGAKALLPWPFPCMQGWLMFSARVLRQLIEKVKDVQTEYNPLWTRRAVVATVATGLEAVELVPTLDNGVVKGVLDEFIHKGERSEKAGDRSDRTEATHAAQHCKFHATPFLSKRATG